MMSECLKFCTVIEMLNRFLLKNESADVDWGGGGRTPTLLNLCLFNETPNLVRY